LKISGQIQVGAPLCTWTGGTRHGLVPSQISITAVCAVLHNGVLLQLMNMVFSRHRWENVQKQFGTSTAAGEFVFPAAEHSTKY
jgi:hypothetical protein